MSTAETLKNKIDVVVLTIGIVDKMAQRFDADAAMIIAATAIFTILKEELHPNSPADEEVKLIAIQDFITTAKFTYAGFEVSLTNGVHVIDKRV
jgi:DhnA family fructose-bisphosphate aldolase class Ia